jgi:hypothetical protein
MRSLIGVALAASLMCMSTFGCSGGKPVSGALSQHSGAKPVKSAGSAGAPDPGPPPPIVKP